MHHHAIKVGRAAERQECVTTSIAPSPPAWEHGPTSELRVHTHAGKTHADTCVQARSGEANTHGGVSQAGRDSVQRHKSPSQSVGLAGRCQNFPGVSLSLLLFLFLFLFQVRRFPSTVVKETIFPGVHRLESKLPAKTTGNLSRFSCDKAALI